MDGKVPRSQKRNAKERGQKHAEESGNKQPQRKPRHMEKAAMPLLVAGKEVLGRELSVFKNSNKNPVWVKGEVKDFDEPTVRHKIRYELPLPEVQTDEEEWVCLGKSMFMWQDEDFVCPLANPTYSAKYTPKKQEAIGQRVKVFWTAMGKWYQGKVVDYDASSGKHRVSFRDGDEKRCLLRQEALVWLDVPQLSSESAIRKMRTEEGEPAAISEGDENQAPIEEGPQSVEKGKADAETAKQHGKQSANGKRRGRSGANKETLPETPCTANQEQRKNGKAATKPSPAAAKQAAAKTAGSGSKSATGNGPAGDLTNGTAVAGEDSKSASSSSLRPVAEPAKAAAKKPAAALQLPGPSTPAALQQLVSTGTNPGSHACTSDPSRKRSRLGLPTQATPAAGEPEPKRRLTVKPGRGAAKPGRKPKRVLEESRLGVRRQKSAADVEFEEACQAILGARLGVWWEDDRCYYKGKVVAHDWYHKRLKVLYDDGFEEFISPQKPDTQYTWLTPRACTAGATDAVHAAFRMLAASNAGGGDAVAAPVPATANGAVAAGTADGSHLDALVPLRQSTGALGVKVEEGRPAGTGPYPVDSTTRAAPSQAKAASGNAWSAVQRGSTTGNGNTMLTGLQAMLQPSSLLQLAGADRKFAVTPEPGAKPAAVQPLPAPLGHAAEGWKVSLVFRGNNQIYQGRVLQYDAQLGRHHVLWDDGEDEWVDAAKEPLTWHADRQKSTGFTAGLPAGQPPPRGEGLVGWRIAVYWKEEKQFYQGTVEDYDAELDQHTISYNDGDELCESLDGQVFKYVLPPTVQTVAAARASTRRRAESPGREAPERRGRRRQRSVDDDDSDEDWGWTMERRPTARAVVVPTALQREAAPGVATPRTCDIRRLNSRLGSLLVYEGEETNADVTPGNSPKFSPRATLGLCAEALPDPRGPPVLDRRVSGLRSAQGFRIGVKRVRVYLPGVDPPSASAAVSGGQASDSKQQQIPSQDTLRRMLARVDAARQAVQNGVPAGEANGSKPGGNGQGTAAEIQAAEAEEAAQQGTSPRATQEEHMTPPPSPFAGYPAREPEEQPQPMLLEPAADCCGAGGGCGNGVPVVANGSMSLPQTPSAASEGQLLAPSRNGSVVSAPILAELAQLKASLPAGGLPKSGNPQKVAG